MIFFPHRSQGPSQPPRKKKAGSGIVCFYFTIVKKHTSVPIYNDEDDDDDDESLLALNLYLLVIFTTASSCPHLSQLSSSVLSLPLCFEPEQQSWLEQGCLEKPLPNKEKSQYAQGEKVRRDSL